jgi:hypothetical protein
MIAFMFYNNTFTMICLRAENGRKYFSINWLHQFFTIIQRH